MRCATVLNSTKACVCLLQRSPSSLFKCTALRVRVLSSVALFSFTLHRTLRSGRQIINPLVDCVPERERSCVEHPRALSSSSEEAVGDWWLVMNIIWDLFEQTLSIKFCSLAYEFFSFIINPFLCVCKLL